jgi:hypothetical protein
MLKVFAFVPWALLVGAAWYYIRLVRHLVLDFATPLGLGFLCFAIIALVVEFIKSGDVGQVAFIWDLTFALLTLALGVYTLTLLDQRFELDLIGPDGIIFAMLVADAWVSPFNAFRTALRNFDHSPH